jgi:sterol desaturase/sphingolipid hydroxylase (fatty acid hydroxylase superfamily)
VGAHSWLQHANVDVRPGPLGYLFSTTDLHRLHHDASPDRGNANYGGTLVLWDLVFGTRREFPREGAPVAVGLERPGDVPDDYLGQLVAPFRSRPE